MAQVTIGGTAIEVALPNFKALKAAWRYIAAVQGETDPMAGIDAILGVISVGAVGAVGESLSVGMLEEQLLPSEMAGLRPFMNTLMIEIGLAGSAPGEPAPSTAEASPSTATSTDLSPNSSPQDAAAAIGT